jgi:hypothetical protein
MGRLSSLKHDSETIFICVDTFARVGFQGNTLVVWRRVSSPAAPENMESGSDSGQTA